jgi:hypothetical protein
MHRRQAGVRCRQLSLSGDDVRHRVRRARGRPAALFRVRQRLRRAAILSDRRWSGLQVSAACRRVFGSLQGSQQRSHRVRRVRRRLSDRVRARRMRQCLPGRPRCVSEQREDSVRRSAEGSEQLRIVRKDLRVRRDLRGRILPALSTRSRLYGLSMSGVRDLVAGEHVLPGAPRSYVADLRRVSVVSVSSVPRWR